MKDLTFIFLLLSGLTQCFPATESQGGNRTVQMFFCKNPGCAAESTKVFCNDEALIDRTAIPDCTGAPPLNTVCQRDGRAFVTFDTDGDCEFEGEGIQIETEKCTEHNNICDFSRATTSAPPTTSAPVTASAPITTSAPVTTSAPPTTSAPVTASAPITISAPVTTSASVTTSAPATTSAPITTSAPVITEGTKKDDANPPATTKTVLTVMGVCGLAALLGVGLYWYFCNRPNRKQNQQPAGDPDEAEPLREKALKP